MSKTNTSSTPPLTPVKRAVFFVLVALAALLLIGVGVVMMQPDTFQIEREIGIKAPANLVFAEVNDFHRWEAWSPWAELDPQMTTTYEGPDTGEGATYIWSGNDEVGEGRMKIVGSLPFSHLQIELEFIKPFAAKNEAEFTFTPQDESTLVRWSMKGKKGFVMKLFHMLVDMDAMVGSDFEKGLERLKAVSEGMAGATTTLPSTPAEDIERNPAPSETPKTN